MFYSFLSTLNSVIWSWPLLFLVFGSGLILTFHLRFLQIRMIPKALRLIFYHESDNAQGEISHFQALMTALAAQLGIGNIAGVATALTVGGRGALFWIWVMAFIGMIVKYAESLLAVLYRETSSQGEMHGGPMYVLSRGLGWQKAAALFACFGLISAFGGGNMIQANSTADVMLCEWGISPYVTALILVVSVAVSLVGGISSIGRICGFLVPAMTLFYLLGALFIILNHLGEVPAAIASVFAHAFSADAATGAGLGLIIQTGVCRGLMMSEAGLGTASIASAATKTDCVQRQALVSMTGVFLATLCMGSMTGIALIVSGQLDSGLTGVALTRVAFEQNVPLGAFIVTFCTILFGFTTLIGWAYYGEKCIEYLVGEKAIPYFRIIFIAVIIPGSLLDLNTVWLFSDVANGLMAFPNLLGLFFLSKVVQKESCGREVIDMGLSEYQPNQTDFA